MQITFFGEAAKQFDQTLVKDKVYLFSNGTVKMANKKFTAIKTDFCLTFDERAIIEEVKEDNRIGKHGAGRLWSYSHL